MHALVVALLFFFGQPFWEAKTPEQWTDREVDSILNDSPWVQTAGSTPPLQVILATARPIEEAESRVRERTKKAPDMAEPDPDYIAFLSDHRDQDFVLAIPYPQRTGLGRAGEQKKLEDDSVMVIGRKSYQMVGYFPPAPGDPVLRLIYERVVKPTDKTVTFRLYLPGVSFPEREVEFRVKDLMYRGKLEM
jgi:hypothetical protein